MRDFIHRVFLPLTLPLVSILVIAVIVLNFSRVLLAVNKHTAAIIAMGVAALVLFGCTYFSASVRPGSSLNTAAPIIFIAVLSLSGVIALASQHPKAKRGPVAAVPAAVTVVAKNTNFENKVLSVSASGPKIGIALKNDDPNEHTLVFDQGAPGFKLDNVKGGGAVVSGAAALEPGTYTFFCDIPGHRQAGMEGKLTVVAPGGVGNAPPGQATPGAAPGGTATTALQFAALDILKFDPATATAPSGTVNFTLLSNASSEHTLAIDGDPTFKPLRVTTKGQTAKGSAKLKPGKYTLYCTVDGHRQAGMVAELTVT